MKIRAQLLLMAAAILLPVILAAGLALENLRESARQAALRGLSETARATALIIDREVQGSLSALQALGSSPHLDNRDFKAFYEQAAAFNQPGDSWIVLFDDKSAQLVNTTVPYGATLITAPPARREQIRKVLSSQKPLVTDLAVGAFTGKLITSVITPAAAAGGQSFVVVQFFGFDYWKKKVLYAALPSDWVVAVLDHNGRIISRSRNAKELQGTSARPELVAAAAASEHGLIRVPTVEGIDVYASFTHSELTGWTIAVGAPVGIFDAAANRAVWLALAGILAAIAVAALAVAAFGRHFIRAIEGASRSAMALGRGQQPVVERTGIEEVNALHHELVGAGALLEAVRKSRHAAEAEREKLLLNETLARESAQAQNLAKDQFLAMLGHELRNPLAAITGATAVLERSGQATPGAQRCLEIISRQNRHLGHIVDDLLNVSRLAAGKLELEKRPLDMADCVGKCVEALRTTGLAAGHTISVQAVSVWFSGDAVRIDQILNNLLTNALKFSEPAGEVKVSVGEDAGRAVVTVQDTGIGIAPELLARVFEPFVQGPTPANRLQCGLGIGLALVRQLLRLHGGDVEAASAGVSQGSTFSFWIPAIAPQLPEKSSRLAAAPTQRKLVYVEDNADARAMLAELLRMFGYEVIEVADGASTLPTVLATRPDAVVMDIGLPDMTGYEVAGQLRADPLTRSIPLIALTGYGQLGDRENAMRAGFDRHLVKPIDQDELVRTIEELLSSANIFKDGVLLPLRD